MSEPCRHEREFAGTQRDTLTSFIKTSGALVKMTAERTALKVSVFELAADLADRDATIERVRALLGDHDGALWAARGVREADIRAALEGTTS